jgi:predicted transcriptional regulator
MVISIRQQIIAMLKHNGQVSATQLSQQLMRTRQDILHHLQELAQAGIVERVNPTQRSSRRGRPTIHYRLTPTTYATDMYILLTAMLKMISNLSNPTELLQKIANQLTGQVQIHTTALTALNGAIEWFNANGYQAGWEASPHGPRIRLRHPLYGSLVELQPILFQLYACILQNLVGDQLEFTQVKQAGSGRSYCIFEQTAASHKIRE